MKSAAWCSVVGAMMLALVAGCGGNVTVETTAGGGGSGGAGGAGGAGGSGPTSSSSGTTTTITDPGNYCSDICNKFNQTGCLTADDFVACNNGCLQVLDAYPECSAPFVAFYDCALAQIPNTGCDNIGDTCENESDAVNQCVGGNTTCGVSECSDGNDSCSCAGDCDGQSFEVDCKISPDGVQCNCLQNGQSIGTCADSDLSCDLFGGCCSDFFFSDG